MGHRPARNRKRSLCICPGKASFTGGKGDTILLRASCVALQDVLKSQWLAPSVGIGTFSSGGPDVLHGSPWVFVDVLGIPWRKPILFGAVQIPTKVRYIHAVFLQMRRAETVGVISTPFFRGFRPQSRSKKVIQQLGSKAIFT